MTAATQPDAHHPPAPRRSPGLDAHDVADGIVVYSAADDTVHHLNALAAAVFELSDGRPRELVAAELADVFGLSPERAEAAVDTAWHDLADRHLLTA
ncbi:PqqD family protein [Kitasatospora phosalacinea]|uniref:PqqD family protein n=1 Tax=Kitasatospora phosalacinea TaxID=2065 RepID=A0ABW6GM12_9ACTN